jgi:FkbM family methyltransferase
MQSIVAFSHAVKALSRDIVSGKHEPETPWMVQAVAGKPIVLHIGASDGRHAFALLKAFPDAHVYAIEPASFNVSVLRKGVAMRGLQKRVTIIHAAVSDHAGEMTLVTPRKTTGKRARAYAFISNEHTDRSDFAANAGFFKEQVKVVRLDDCRFDRVDFIRMDIEGAEFAALTGGLQTLDRELPNCLIEIHPVILRERFGSSEDEVAALFRSRGYRFFALGADGIEERFDLNCGKRSFQDFFFIHPSRALPEGVFQRLMSTPGGAA